MWSFEEFWTYIDQALSLAHVPGDANAPLGDIELDSLQMIELLYLMEDLGAEIHEDLLPSLVTAGDLFHHFITRVTAERGP